jgi:peptidoglycan/LPS O-acetylase OafA/YrhL
MPAFLLGALIGAIDPKYWRKGWVFYLGLAILLSTNILLGHGGFTRLPEMFGATLVVGCTSVAPLPVLQARISKFLGEISYPFYLIHPMGMIFATAVIAQVPAAPPLLRILLFAVVSIAIAMPTAWLLHIALELPSMNAGRKLRLRPNPPAALAQEP